MWIESYNLMLTWLLTQYMQEIAQMSPDHYLVRDTCGLGMKPGVFDKNRKQDIHVV